MHKSIFVACIAAIAAGSIEMLENGSTKNFPGAVAVDDDDVKMNGSLGELHMKQDGEDKILAHVGWRTGGVKFGNGAWVQTYAQWPDPSSAGKLMGVTCNAQYSRNQKYASEVKVENMYGDKSLVNRDNLDEGKWSDYGALNLGDVAMFEADVSDTKVDTYASTYSGGDSYQSCGAIAILWSAKDGDSYDESRNERYWDIKDAPAVKITAGFRVWDDPDDDEPEYWGDGEEFTY